MAAIKAGDLVKLRSGGPTMTVTAIMKEHGSDKVYCLWFTETNHDTVNRDYFSPEVLEQASGEKAQFSGGYA